MVVAQRNSSSNNKKSSHQTIKAAKKNESFATFLFLKGTMAGEVAITTQKKANVNISAGGGDDAKQEAQAMVGGGTRRTETITQSRELSARMMPTSWIISRWGTARRHTTREEQATTW